MGKIVAMICICLIGTCFTQDVLIGERKMILKNTASFYRSNSLNSDVVHYYLGGHQEIFFSDKYSIRGDLYSLLGEIHPHDYSMKNSQLINIGFNRNFTKKRFSLSTGVFTGVSILSLRSLNETFAPDLTHPKYECDPIFGLNLGAQYFFHKHFHFFVEMRYVHQENPFSASYLDEIMYSAGLGFQTSLKKRKK
jgi:hypothetical protein